MLLYGPPGTGKTLIARQLGKMLNGREPKVVNGPEVLNKFVGRRCIAAASRLHAAAYRQHRLIGQSQSLQENKQLRTCR